MALIKCKECGKEISDKADKCPHCGCPVSYSIEKQDENIVTNTNIVQEERKPNTEQKVANTKKEKKKDSVLSIIAAVLSIFTCTYIIGFVIAIIDLCIANSKDKKGKERHIGSWFAIIFGIVATIVLWPSGSDDNQLQLNTTEITTEVSTEATTEEATEEETTEISEEDFKSQAQEVTYEDIYRNPETYKNKPIKITLYVNKFDTQFLGAIDVYYCLCEGKDVFVTDYRDVKEPTIASGDTVVVYGVGAGMATLTESQRNVLGIKTDSEKSKIPSIDMEYVELK